LVLLARALAQEPQFIVLDEPTASLDFGNQGKVMGEIRALAESGHGVLFTTHDPNHALRAADRAYLLRDGIRIADGAVATVLNRNQLEALYHATVEHLTDPESGAVAFLLGSSRPPIRRCIRNRVQLMQHDVRATAVVRPAPLRLAYARRQNQSLPLAAA